MESFGTGTRFGGSIAKLYGSHLVPLICEPYAAELAKRVAAQHPSRVPETSQAIQKPEPTQPGCAARDLRRDMSRPARIDPR